MDNPVERRRSRRITVNLKAERLSCTRDCSVFIENLSERGIYMITAPAKKNDYIPGTELNIRLKLSTGESINLRCNVKWSFSNSPDESTNSVGLEIIDPPERYKEFVRSLH